jgi:hypothetical protein
MYTKDYERQTIKKYESNLFLLKMVRIEESQGKSIRFPLGLSDRTRVYYSVSMSYHGFVIFRTIESNRGRRDYIYETIKNAIDGSQ